jgi:hypothetical protein
MGTQESMLRESSGSLIQQVGGVLRTDASEEVKSPVTSSPCCDSQSPCTTSSSPPTASPRRDWTHLFEDLSYKAFVVGFTLLAAYAVVRAVYNTVSYFAS